MGGPQARVDYFISYTAADRAWAEWIAWQLEGARYTTVLQAWDFRPGDNFVIRMRDALETADRTLAVVSAAYLASSYCTDEWTGAFLHDKDRQGRLLPVRIEACTLPRLLATRVYIDLVGLGRQQARAHDVALAPVGPHADHARVDAPGGGETFLRHLGRLIVGAVVNDNHFAVRLKLVQILENGP